MTVKCDVCGDELTERELALVWADTDFIPHGERGHYIGVASTPENFTLMREAHAKLQIRCSSTQ